VTALFDVMALHTYRSEQDVADAQDFATAAGPTSTSPAPSSPIAAPRGQAHMGDRGGVANGEPLTNPKHVATADEQASRCGTSSTRFETTTCRW